MWVGGGRANAKKGERKGKMGVGGKIVDKQCTSCNVVDGYSRV